MGLLEWFFAVEIEDLRYVNQCAPNSILPNIANRNTVTPLEQHATYVCRTLQIATTMFFLALYIQFN